MENLIMAMTSRLLARKLGYPMIVTPSIKISKNRIAHST